MKLGKVYYKKYRDIRLKKRFAFLPKILSNNEQIWFENYYSYEIYRRDGIAWAANNWKPDYKWCSEYTCLTLKEIKEYLKNLNNKIKKDKEENIKMWKTFEKLVKGK